ncbi:MAG TPA: hypothetical protein VFR23_10470 [Jiangellaceae bacterium]|nr:hypothetical protein [Jiangellaceae bacterium]
MFASTPENARWIRRTGIVAGTVALAVAAAMVAPQAFGYATEAPQRADKPAAADVEVADVEVTHEQGVAIAGSGELDGRRVFVEIYGNSLYGSQATVVVEPRGGPELSATVELVTEDLLEGGVELDMALSRNTRGGQTPTRDTARVTGSWKPSGLSTEIDETFVDAGYVIHTTGTNNQLAAEVTVTVDGEQVSLQMFDAFAFDLTITRTPL